MNLFLRLFLVWLKARFKAPKALLDEVTSHFHVWLTDQDMFRHMTNSRYFSLTDVCIVDYMLQTRAWPKVSKRGWLPIVVYEDLVFHRMLRWPQKFAVVTRLEGWGEAYVVLRHAFRRADGTTTAEGYTVARFVSTKGERIPTADVIAVLDPGRASPPLSDAAQAALARAVDGYGFADDDRPDA